MNAYVAPALERYLTNVRDGLAAADVRAPTPGRALRRRADEPRVGVQEPGADGAVGPCRRGQRRVVRRDSHAGFDRILTFDMGGTSTDVAVCVSGRPEITRETKRRRLPRARPRGRRRQHRRGRRLDRLRRRGDGRAQGRPARARAPFPARRATAAAARRRRSPTRTSSSATCRRGCSAASSSSTSTPRYSAVARVAEARGAGVEETARAIVSMVDEAMLGALRVVTVQRGRVPGEFALVAFGGAGGLHANALARILGSLPGDRAGGVRRALGARLHRLRDQERVQPDVREEHRGDDAGRRPRALRGAHGARARLARRESVARRRPGRPLHPRHAVRPPGLRDPDRAGRRRARRARPRGARAALRRGAQPALRVRARGRRGDREPAGRRAPAACRSRARDARRTAGATRRRRRRARNRSGRREGTLRRPDLRARRARAGHGRSTATRSSSSTTRPRSCCRATAPSSTRG